MMGANKFLSKFGSLFSRCADSQHLLDPFWLPVQDVRREETKKKKKKRKLDHTQQLE